MMSMEALLTNPDPVVQPRPFVKWSYEPPRPQDVPAALARAYHLAQLPPLGPVFVSVPMDDWSAEADEVAARQVTGRATTGRAAPDPAALERSRAPARGRVEPGAGRRPRRRRRAAGWDAAVALAERCRLPVWAPPASGSGRVGFPEDHPNFQGLLPPAIGPLAQTLEPYDLVLVVGAPVFTYYPYIPGPVLPEGTSLVLVTNDPQEAARAPAGDAIVADVALTLEALLAQAETPDRPPPEARPGTRAPARLEPDRRCGRDGGARRRAPRRGHRRQRVAFEHDRLSQSGAAVAPVELLHGRRRRARLRAARRGRHAARASRTGRWSR